MNTWYLQQTAVFDNWFEHLTLESWNATQSTKIGQHFVCRTNDN